jgi:hypothetical protein
MKQVRKICNFLWVRRPRAADGRALSAGQRTPVLRVRDLARNIAVSSYLDVRLQRS